jgi:hypothetical protein
MNTYDDDSFEEKEYEFVVEQMDKLFPKLPFSYNTDDYYKLDDVLVDYPYALIYQNRTCYCVGSKDPTPITLIINSYNGKNITYRNFYEEVEKKWDRNYWVCNHHFLEGLSVKNNIIDLWFGS